MTARRDGTARNTLIIVFCSLIGTVLSSSIVAYAFSRMKFPGRNLLFTVLISTMMKQIREPSQITSPRSPNIRFSSV